MKKLKLLPSILMLVLCVGVLAVGVFAITPTQNTISGQITINASNPEVAIDCFINDTKIVSYDSVRSGIDWGIENFNIKTDNVNTVHEIEDTILTLRITNKSNKHLGAYFCSTAKNDYATASDILTYSEINGTGDFASKKIFRVYFKSYSYIAPSTDENENNVVDMQIAIRCDEIDTKDIISEMFSYYLNIEEYTTTVTSAQLVFDNALNVGSKDLSGLVKVPYTGITQISQKAFANNTNVTHVVIPSTISSDINNNIYGIGKSAFANCTALQGVSIPKTVTLLSTSIFMSSGLKSIFLPEGIIDIYWQALGRCGNLEMVYFSSTVKTIATYTFAFCNLDKIKLPEGLTFIGYSAFSTNPLYYVELPNSLEKVEELIFEKCTNLYSVKLPENEKFIEIGHGMFHSCSSLTNVEIPKNVKNINHYAFYGTALVSINLPQSVEYVGRDAFGQCVNLKNISLINVKNAQGNIFEGCTNLQSVILPQNAENIDVGIFWDATINNYYEYKGGKYIGNGTNNYLALYSLVSTDITNLEIHPSCQYILEGALAGTTNLQQVKLPDNLINMVAVELNSNKNLQTIDENNCRYLSYGNNKYVLVGTYEEGTETIIENISEKCTLIAGNAFRKLSSNITTVNLPSTINSVPMQAFKGGQITSIDLSNVTEIGDMAFYDCSSLTNVTLSSNIKSIGAYAFTGAGISSINLPESLETIDYLAFRATSLTSITIPANVKEIKLNAFWTTTAITTVTINSKTVFGSINSPGVSCGYLINKATKITVPTQIANEEKYADSVLIMHGFVRTDDASTGMSIYQK